MSTVIASPQPPDPPGPQPDAAVIALLPMWARAAVVLVPLFSAGLGSVGGVLGGGQAASKERAILATKVERLEADQRETRAELAAKIDRLTDLILQQRDKP